jgi:hypothetical protein
VLLACLRKELGSLGGVDTGTRKLRLSASHGSVQPVEAQFHPCQFLLGLGRHERP